MLLKTYVIKYTHKAKFCSIVIIFHEMHRETGNFLLAFCSPHSANNFLTSAVYIITTRKFKKTNKRNNFLLHKINVNSLILVKYD